MTESLVAYKFGSEGEQQLLRTLADLERRLKSLQRATKSTTRANNTSTRAARETGRSQQQLARDYDKAVAAANRSARAQQQASRGFQFVSRQAQNAGRSIGMVGNSIAESAFSLSTAIPAMRGFGMQAAMAGGNMVTFGASFGPVGVAIAGLLGVAPMLVDFFSDTADGARSAAVEANTLENAIRQVEEASRSAALTRRVRGGTGTVSEQRGLVLQLERQIAELDVSLAAQRSRRPTGGVAEFMQRRESLARIEATRARFERQLTEARRHVGGAQGRVSREADRERDRERQAEAREREAEERQRRSRARRGASAARRRRRADQRGLGTSLEEELRESGLTQQQLENDPLTDRGGGLFIDPGQAARDVTQAQRRNVRDAERERERERRAAAKEELADIRRANAAWEHRLQIYREEREARRNAIRDASEISEGVLDLFNASEGQMELTRGLSQVAQAVGSWPDFVGIAKHSLSAALHFKNAARLGVGGGGGTADAGAGAGGRQNVPSAAPAATSTPANITVVQHINDPLDQYRAGRVQRTSAELARRAYGGRV